MYGNYTITFFAYLSANDKLTMIISVFRENLSLMLVVSEITQCCQSSEHIEHWLDVDVDI